MVVVFRRMRWLAVLLVALFLTGCGSSQAVPKDVQDTVSRFYQALLQGDLDTLRETVSGNLLVDLPTVAGPYVQYALRYPDLAKGSKAELIETRLVAQKEGQWAVVDVLLTGAMPSSQGTTEYGVFSERLHLWKFSDGWRIFSRESGGIIP